MILKFTYDNKRFGHYEVGGLGRWFRDRYYPNQTLATASAAGGQNNTKVGGGFFANLRFPVTHFADVGLHGLGGTGVGRYGTSTLPDTTVHPDGTLAPIKGYQGLFSLELHPTKKLDLDGYAGAEYAQRTTYLSTLGSSAGKLIGYAPITSSNAGCGIETLPTSAGNGLAGGAPYNPGNSCQLPRRNPGRSGVDRRVCLSLLQQPQVWSSAVRHAVTAISIAGHGPGLAALPRRTTTWSFTSFPILPPVERDPQTTGRRGIFPLRLSFFPKGAIDFQSCIDVRSFFLQPCLTTGGSSSEVDLVRGMTDL